MRRAILLLLPAVLLVLVALTGCDDESKPRFARIEASPKCGVAPMAVEFRAMATGGNEGGDPTGGNNNLDVTWDFGGDGTGSTTVSYHTFEAPGVYMVTATANDPDGSTTSISQEVVVKRDALDITASSDFPGGAVTVNDTIHFDLRADACAIDPDVEDDYRNLVFDWSMNDDSGTVFTNHRPRYTFDTPGTYAVTVAVSFTEMAVTRWDTLVFEVTDPEGP